MTALALDNRSASGASRSLILSQLVGAQEGVERQEMLTKLLYDDIWYKKIPIQHERQLQQSKPRFPEEFHFLCKGQEIVIDLNMRALVRVGLEELCVASQRVLPRHLVDFISNASLKAFTLMPTIEILVNMIQISPTMPRRHAELTWYKWSTFNSSASCADITTRGTSSIPAPPFLYAIDMAHTRTRKLQSKDHPWAQHHYNLHPQPSKYVANIRPWISSIVTPWHPNMQVIQNFECWITLGPLDNVLVNMTRVDICMDKYAETSLNIAFALALLTSHLWVALAFVATLLHDNYYLTQGWESDPRGRELVWWASERGLVSCWITLALCRAACWNFENLNGWGGQLMRA
jgi:hypothetical protein